MVLTLLKGYNLPKEKMTEITAPADAKEADQADTNEASDNNTNGKEGSS